MLLIEPPMREHDWLNAQATSPEFLDNLASYCHEYEMAVVSLPHNQIAMVIA